MALLLTTLLGSAGACGNDAVAVDSCREVEEARCQWVPSCPDFPVDQARPVRDGPDGLIEACVRYYRDACLHGLVTNVDPGSVQTRACVDAIRQGDCSVAVHPENHPACAWLNPPVTAPATDAAADVEVDGGAVPDASANDSAAADASAD